MSSRAETEPRPLTSWRALAVVLVLVAGIVGGGAWAISQQIRSRVLDATIQSTSFVSSLVVDRAVTYSDIRGGMHPQNRAELDADIYLLRSRQQLLGLRIWSLTGGQLVYRDPDQHAVDGRLGGDLLARARTGEQFATASGAEDAGSVTIFYPYDANGDGGMDAVAEVILPRQEVDAAIADSTRLLNGGSLLVLLLALLGIMQVRRRQVVQDRAATHDLLTGLGNRILLHRRAGPLLAGASAAAPASLLMLDLDGFKSVNDTLGHHAGDELLVAVADALRATARREDTVIRLGGDEFAVLMPQTALERAVDAAARLRQALRVPVQLGGLTVEIDASIGVATAPRHHTGLSGLMHCADVAMYQAKQTGAGVVAYDAADDLRGQRTVTVLPELRRALHEGQLDLHFQPIVDAAGTVRDIEALLRWRHPERGMLNAAEFLPAVERTSLVRPLTEWALGRAARECAEWRRAGYDARVTVNVSARTLTDPALPGTLLAAASAAGVPVTALRLELPESEAAGRPTAVADALRRLDKIGVGVVLDDVCAGFPALTRLDGAVPAAMKIDPELAGAVRHNAAARHAITGLVGYAASLGLGVVAEGVEDCDTRRAVTALGCDAVQGYAVCPPLPSQELADWLAAHAGPAGPAGPAIPAMPAMPAVPIGPAQLPGTHSRPRARSAPLSEGTTP